MLIPTLFRRSAFFSLAALVGAILPAAAQPSAAAGGPGTAAAKITAVKFLQLTGGPQKARFILKIQGENLPTSAVGTTIRLYTKEPGKPVENQAVTFVTSAEIDVSGEAPVGTVITTVDVVVGDKATPGPEGMTLSIKPLPPEAQLKEFGIKLDHQKSKDFPNLHSLIVTRESGDPGAGFAANPNHMSVEIEPAGTTDLKILQSNREQLELHFVAAADYEPKNVLVTVYDSSDLDRRRPISVAKPAAPAEDSEAPKIAKVETLFVDRSAGTGRLRIYGKGFGIQRPAPFPVDDYLCNCLERLKVTGYRTCGILGNDQGPPKPKQPAPTTRKLSAVEKGELESYAKSGEKGGPEALTRRVQERLTLCTKLAGDWKDWRGMLGGHVTVGVNSRNPDIRVEKAEVIDANDGMIDVYFEFTRYPGYAWPFRLAGVDVTISKMINKVEQTVKAAEVYGEVGVATPKSFDLPWRIGPEPDPNLTYQYTILDSDAALSLLGQGVADNFYVLQLSVVNHGKKKVTIPLAAIQAEVEWLRGDRPWKRGDSVREVFLEGSPTVAPIPLAAVSAYFGAYQKDKGLRTRFFNVLEGVTILATALVPFTGPALKDAEIMFSGGVIPALRQGWTDLSAQQLQNLTSLSWESSETLAAGESTAKYIYLQRKSQFQDPPEPISEVPARTGKQISNIMALEVTGFEVPDTPAKLFTPDTEDSAAPKPRHAAASPANSTPPGP